MRCIHDNSDVEVHMFVTIRASFFCKKNFVCLFYFFIPEFHLLYLHLLCTTAYLSKYLSSCASEPKIYIKRNIKGLTICYTTRHACVAYDEKWAPFYDEQLSTNADIKHTVTQIYGAIRRHKLQA